MTSTLGAELAGAQPLSTDKARSRRQSYRSAACSGDGSVDDGVSVAGTPAASDAWDKHARESSQTPGGVVATLAITHVGLCARPQVPTQLGSSGCRVGSHIEGHVHRRPL
jgi:hypothetical protein